jgi:DNA-binding CsgD family transcriptional regulator
MFWLMLHGRSEEIARIDELLAAARTGRSGALVVRGEPGVGKTVLLDYAAATAGMRVLRSTGIESESELPFAALRLLLRSGLARLDILPPPQASALRGAFGLAEAPAADRFLIGLAALSLLAELAGDRALLCLVDDAHWLDRASADALLFAARRLEAEGVVLLMAAREDGFHAPRLAELPLGRLDGDAARALLAERASGLPSGLADRVLAEADGNPLALIELPSALTDSPAALTDSPVPLPLPRRIQQSYYRQVADLPAPTRAFLLVAAAEESGDLPLIRRAAQSLDIPATAVDAAERSGLVTVAQLTVAFRHPLVRAAVYQGATSAERAAAHAGLAGALAGEPDADRRAWHRAAAASGPDEPTAAELEQAAARARQRLGYAAAAAALERAARLTPGPADQARRLTAAAGAALDAGRPDTALALADRAQPLTAEPAARAEIARIRAWVAMERGAMRSVHELVVAGAAPIAGSDPAAAAAMLMLGAVAGSWAGDAKLVQDAADRMAGLEPSQPSSPAGLVPGRASLQAMADLLAGRPALGVPGIRKMIAEVRRDQPGQLDVRFYAANMAMLIGDFDTAGELMLSTAQACRVQGVIRFLAPLSLGLSYASFGQNRFRFAAETAIEGLRLAEDTGQPVRIGGLHSMLALLAAVRGDEPRCRELAASALDSFAVEEVANVTTMAEWALGLLDLGLGRYGAALEQFELAASAALRHVIQATLFAPDQVEAAMRLGAAERAAEPLARFAAWSRATGQPWAQAVLHRCQAMVTAGESAEDHYREALHLHAGSGHPFEHARTALLYGEWLRRNRHGTDARTRLRSAVALFERTGAGPWIDRARAELRAAGEPAAQGASAPDLLSLLTPQELQVVRLAASGATNRDIAAQLFISPRTVSHHLYRAFPKLGVINRTALARLDLTRPDDLT